MLNNMDAKSSLLYQPILKELEQVGINLKSLGKHRDDHLLPLLDYLFDRGGKGIRPAITLLASTANSKDTSTSITMATAVELLHIATLIHDDTVDNSALRRGKETISNRWGQNVAVLLGDYIFAASATFVCDTQNIRVIKRFSETIMDLSSGQLLEYFSVYTVEKNLHLYNERIYRKTASLFQTAAESGAILGGSPEHAVKALKDYGYNIGMAFQIVDDILDVQGEVTEIGKPVGNDLLQGVLTLPSIKLLEQFPENNPIKNLFEHNKDQVYLTAALDMIQNSTIIEECYAVAEHYCRKAQDAIKDLPKSSSLDSLATLATYVTERRN